jgi:hypothetical protein
VAPPAAARKLESTDQVFLLSSTIEELRRVPQVPVEPWMPSRACRHVLPCRQPAQCAIERNQHTLRLKPWRTFFRRKIQVIPNLIDQNP